MSLLAEPIPVRVTRYRCPFCRRGHSTKARAVDHIGRCWHNPAVRACKTCAHNELCECEPEVGYCCGTCATGLCAAGVQLRDPDGSWQVEMPCPKWAPKADEGESR